MFTEFSLRNYRTHILTRLDLHPVTLLIGNNNSGKSNLLLGLWHFAKLISRSRPGRIDPQNKIGIQLMPSDLFPHRHRLAPKDEPMAVECKWSHNSGYSVTYSMELYEDNLSANHVSCIENISVNKKGEIVHISPDQQTYTTGSKTKSDKMLLRKNLSEINLDSNLDKILRSFFMDLSHINFYYLQPSQLKGKSSKPLRFEPSHDGTNGSRLQILSSLGLEGSNFQDILRYISENDERTYNRFVAALRRFDKSFQGVHYDKEKEEIRWQFDIGSSSPSRLVEEFNPNVISDGLVKAAAISLLTCLERPPAMFLLEEIENGINPGNIREFLSWIFKAASTTTEISPPQFILTTHSPVVIREFTDILDQVFNVRLDKVHHKSDVRNLSDALDALIGIGTIEGNIDDSSGKRRVKVTPNALTELWLSGAIG
jgi:AAA15 family ATPase/GTPase